MWPDREQTSELLARAAQGDGGAIDQLLARHREPLRQVVEMRLDRAIAARVDASDIVQETLLDASRRLAGYLANPSLPFHLWLRQIARDRLIDAHRRHRAAGRRSVDRERRLDDGAFAGHSSIQLLQQLAAPELTPAAAALRRELARRFEAAIAELGDDDREIILLRHFEGLPNQEAAAALELSEPAAGMRYLRALRRLRGLLGEDGGGSRP